MIGSNQGRVADVWRLLFLRARSSPALGRSLRELGGCAPGGFDLHGYRHSGSVAALAGH